MRPAQIAREIGAYGARYLYRGRRFNEARANCAGNLGKFYDLVEAEIASMRPAQIAREILDFFNKEFPASMASMRPAQIAREIEQLETAIKQTTKASMRPAQIAREILRDRILAAAPNALQ